MQLQGHHSFEGTLNSLIAEYKEFASGSPERILQFELIHAFAKKYHIELHSYQEFKDQLSSLGKLYEKFEKKMGVIPSDIKDALNKIKDNDDLYDNLLKLKSKIIPINVLDLEKLIERTRESQKLIQDKDVVLFIGNTGSGKSTAILKFLGYNLKVGKQHGLQTLLPTTEVLAQHQSFKTSPVMTSCTRYINAVPFPNEMYPKGTTKKTLVICDSPGFGDSAGVEVDIANGVGTINALHKARSVRVVVIIPYDSLTANRMKGAVNISQIVCSLFNNLELQSIMILFNKVPEAKIESLPNLIESKMENLNPQQKSNQRLQEFIKHMLDEAKKMENFYNPLLNNENKIFKNIIDLSPIKNVKKQFMSDFFVKTKIEIKKFTKSTQHKIIEHLNAWNLQEAQFHLKILSKLKHILHSDKQIQDAYNKVGQLIQKASQKEFTHYQQVMRSMIGFQQLQESKQKAFKNSYERIQEMSRLFKGFDGIKIVSNDRVVDMTEQMRANMNNQFKDHSTITFELVKTVKIFSQIFGSDLAKRIGVMLENRYDQLYRNFQSEIKRKKLKNAKVSISNLNNLRTFAIHLLGKPSVQTSKNRENELKLKLNNEANSCFSQLQGTLSQQTLIVSQNTVIKLKQNIQTIKIIHSLKFVDKNKQMGNRFTKFIQQLSLKVKQNLKQLQSIKPSIQQNQKQKLIRKHNQIKLLMSIEEISHVDYQYTQTLENMKRKNVQNIQKLKQFIEGLKNNSETIYKKIDKIKNSLNLVIQYGQILDDKYDINEIKEPINEYFKEYLQNQSRQFRKIDSLTNIEDVQTCYHKITAYQKLDVLGEDVKQLVQSIKSILIKKLSQPFVSFKEGEIPSIKGLHYRFIIYILQSLQRLAIYSAEIEDKVSVKFYNQISKDEQQIKDQLRKCCSKIRADVFKFIQISTEEQKPVYFQLMMKTLQAISNKMKASKYLKSNVGFDVKNLIQQLNNKLNTLKDQLQIQYKKAQKTMDKLSLIVDTCKFYSEMEDLFKTDPQSPFNTLYYQCNMSLQNLQKDDEKKIQKMLNSQPNKIDFQLLKKYYDRFKAQSKNEDSPKVLLIENSLKKMEDEKVKKLNEIENENKLSPQKAIELLHAYTQIVVLQQHIPYFYKNAQIDKNLIRKMRINIIECYQQECIQLKKCLQQYDFIKYDKKFSEFSAFQSTLFQVFPLQQLYQAQSFSEEQKFKGMFNIKELAGKLKESIFSNQFIGESEKIIAKKTFNLRGLMKILKIKYTLENQNISMITFF